MTNKKTAKPNRPPVEPRAGESGFYDELITAQPDATREFYRERLAKKAIKPTPPEPHRPPQKRPPKR